MNTLGRRWGIAMEVVTRALFLATLCSLLSMSPVENAGAQISDERVPRDAKWIARATKKIGEINENRGGILVLGDSIAARWPRELQVEMFGRNFVNLAVGGDRIENVLWRLNLYDLPAAEPQAVLLIIGTNNLRSDRDGELIWQRLETLIGAIKSVLPSTPMLVADIMPRGKNLRFQYAQRAILNQRIYANTALGYTPVRFSEVITEHCDGTAQCPLYDDSVHPSIEGYNLLGGVLRRALAAG